jgi:hypothetical protein
MLTLRRGPSRLLRIIGLIGAGLMLALATVTAGGSASASPAVHTSQVHVSQMASKASGAASATMLGGGLVTAPVAHRASILLPEITICLLHSPSHCAAIQNNVHKAGQQVWLWNYLGEAHWFEVSEPCGDAGCLCPTVSSCIAFEDVGNPSLCLAAPTSGSSGNMELGNCELLFGGTALSAWEPLNNRLRNIFWTAQDMVVDGSQPLYNGDPLFVWPDRDITNQWVRWTGP